MKVEVVYAWLEGEDAVSVDLPSGATLADALAASGIAARHPEISLACVGIFGKRVPAGTRLAEGDRVEIYRALVADPKEARRRRASRKAKT